VSLFTLSPADTRLLNICLQAVGRSYPAQLGSFPRPVFLPEHSGSEGNPCPADGAFPSRSSLVLWTLGLVQPPSRHRCGPEQRLEPRLSSLLSLSKRCDLSHGLRKGSPSPSPGLGLPHSLQEHLEAVRGQAQPCTPPPVPPACMGAGGSSPRE